MSTRGRILHTRKEEQSTVATAIHNIVMSFMIEIWKWARYRQGSTHQAMHRARFHLFITSVVVFHSSMVAELERGEIGSEGGRSTEQKRIYFSPWRFKTINFRGRGRRRRNRRRQEEQVDKPQTRTGWHGIINTQAGKNLLTTLEQRESIIAALWACPSARFTTRHLKLILHVLQHCRAQRTERKKQFPLTCLNLPLNQPPTFRRWVVYPQTSPSWCFRSIPNLPHTFRSRTRHSLMRALPCNAQSFTL